MKKIVLVLLVAIVLTNSFSAQDQVEQMPNNLSSQEQTPKITIDPNTEIVFGQSASLSGHFQLYGNIIKHAILACFESVNSQGGINGKKLRLISLDDQGNVEQTKKNVTYLRSLGIDMFIGNMGTRSQLALLPLIEQKKIAVFFPWGGDEKLRNPKLSHIINGLGLLKPQLEALVTYIAETLQFSSIAIFNADDDFSSQGAETVTTLLNKYDITPLAQNSYNRFTFDIELAAKKLIAADPRVVVCLSTSMAAVKLINEFFQQGHFGTTFIGIDSTLFVSDILKKRGVPFTYTSPVPDPATSTLPIAEQYRHSIKKYFPAEDFNVISFGYYLSARIIVEALKSADDNLNKENIIKNIEQMKNFNLDGFVLTFDAKNRHAFGQEAVIIKG